MTPEQFAEAVGRGMMQALLGAQTVAPRARPSSARRGSNRGTAARVTEPAASPVPEQRSMFEPPNAAPLPSIEELDKIMGITRMPEGGDPPGTYRPDEAEVKPWIGT